MKVGLLTYYVYDPHESLAHVRSTTAEAVGRDHQIVPYPEEFPFASPPRQRELLKQWLEKCDVVIGSLDGIFLTVREDIAKPIPYVCFLLGQMSRGAGGMVWAHEHLRSYDILVGNCAADVTLAKKFFPNATIRLLPFAYDETLYYPVERCDARERLGIESDSPLFVYAGRITLEKNLHTLLKAFRIVTEVEPKAKLIIAGDEVAAPFREFGSYPVAVKRTLHRLASHLKLTEDQVLFVGNQRADQLREIYSAADMLVNLTLHHDENFGLVQVEAMACGLPAVGTAWGGLRDTIVPSITGEHIDTLVTASGVKADWWQAANKMISLLKRTRDDEDFRRNCTESARQRYSMANYQASLTNILFESVTLATRSAECVEPSQFAKGYWSACVAEPVNGQSGNSQAPYRRGSESWRFYRELISSFAAPARSNGEILRNQGWCLAAPLTMQGAGAVAINDPIYPLHLEIPPDQRHGVRDLIERFSEQPVIEAAAFQGQSDDQIGALAWMQETGLLIKTDIHCIDARRASGQLGKPTFAIEEVDHRADVISFV